MMNDKEFYLCENIKKMIMANAKKKCIELEYLPPILSASDDYFVSISKELLRNERYCYTVCSADGDHTVILSDGLDVLPICLRDVVVKNDWFCLAVQDMSCNDGTIAVSFMIFYDSIGKISIIKGEVNPMVLCSEISMCFSLDDNSCLYDPCITGYSAWFNYAALCVGDCNSDFRCEVSMLGELDYEIDRIDWIDMSGIKYLEQCLRWRCRTI